MLTYWGLVHINNEKYYLFIVDNDDNYSSGEMTKLAEIIELAMGMWKYTPERDAKAELVADARQQESGVFDPRGSRREINRHSFGLLCQRY